MAATTLSQVYPLGSRLNEAGRLEVGGCDVVELAKEFGTPAYVYAEDDMRARAREFQEAFGARTRALRGDLREQGVPLHGRLPAVRRGGALVRRGQRGRAAPGARGRLRPGADLHAREQQDRRGARSTRSSAASARSCSTPSTRSTRLQRIAPRQRVMLRVTPGIKPSTHSYIQTGQVDSKFGFAIDDVPQALERLGDLELTRAARPHRVADLRARAVREARRGARRAGRLAAAQPRRRARDRVHGRRRAALDRRLRRRAAAARAEGRDRPVRAGPGARGQRRA